jgi:hypothetical protein
MKIADAKISVPKAAPQINRSRRTYAQQFKRDVVAQCLVPGVSVSAIALGHGINANVIRKCPATKVAGRTYACGSANRGHSPAREIVQPID